MVGGIKDMKTIKVVAAVICDNIKEKNKIFATARGYGELKGGISGRKSRTGRNTAAGSCERNYGRTGYRN
jgi:nucleoid DNA-binding protein